MPPRYRKMKSGRLSIAFLSLARLAAGAEKRGVTAEDYLAF
jgi:hypothetical protein